MTKDQNRGYWRRWSAAIKAYCRENAIERMPADQANLIRYACHAQLGLPASHTEFNSSDHVTRIFELFEYMARTGDCKSFIPRPTAGGYSADEHEIRKRYLRRICAMDAAAVRAITRELTRGATEDPDALSTRQLKVMVIELSGRERAAERKRREAALNHGGTETRSGLPAEATGAEAGVAADSADGTDSDTVEGVPF